MSTRRLAIGLCLNRIQYGLGLIARPERGARVWVGTAAARREPTRLLARAVGARDLVLGAGGLLALRDPGSGRVWFAAHAVSDGVDFVATAAADDIPLGSRVITLALAGASTAIAAAYVIDTLRR